MGSSSALVGGAAWTASFRYRDFRHLWLSGVVQSVGMGMEFVALGWLVFDITDSPFMVAMASAARMAPFFFLGLVSGAVADRVERRIAVRWTTLAGALIAALMTVSLSITEGGRGAEGAGFDYWRVLPILALTVCMGSVWAFNFTLRQAYTYDIVGPSAALNGMSLLSLSQRVGGVAGAVAAGWVIADFGIGSQYLAIGGCYALSAAMLLWTREAGQSAVRTSESVTQNLIACLKIIRDNRILLTLMLLAAATEILGFTHESLLPVFAKDVLGVGAVGLGWIFAFRQGGGLVGLLLLAAISGSRRKGLIIFLVAGAFGLGEMAFSLGGGFIAFVAILAFINACASVVDTLYKTLMQENVENEQRGRAMGAWVLSIGVAPVGHLGVGALASAFGAGRALLINGSILAAVSVATALALPRIRRLP